MRRLLSASVLVIVMALLAGCVYLRRLPTQSRPSAVMAPAGTQVSWPDEGSAAVAVQGGPDLGSRGGDVPVPIASIAKVMTAFLMLRDHPLNDGDGFILTITDPDVQDTARRRSQDQSLVPVTVGERLTERQALHALLIPFANNIAVMLANYDRGGLAAFVAEMNAEAKALGMLHTTYTDPSGFQSDTVSTAADELRLLAVAMPQPAFAKIVGLPEVTLPVVGTVSNTDSLLGRDGFIGVKTGSDDDAGGCFMFDSVQVVQGRLIHIIGVVLGQLEGPLIPAALNAAERLVDSVVSRLARSSDPKS